MANTGQYKAKDLTGQRYEMVTAIRSTNKKTKAGDYVWLMRCDCGREFERPAGKFRQVKSCGCKTKDNTGQFDVLDLSGFQTESSVAIRPTDKRKHTYTIWIMRCLLCGDEFETAAYNITKGKAAHRCPAYIEKYGNKVGRPAIPDNGSHVNSIYAHYIQSAKVRGIVFELTKEQARIFFEQPCAYCGISPTITYTSPNLAGQYAWNGIDRIDSKLGYTVDNCVPCCATCNFAKSTATIDDFKHWVERVYRHLFLAKA